MLLKILFKVKIVKNPSLFKIPDLHNGSWCFNLLHYKNEKGRNIKLQLIIYFDRKYNDGMEGSISPYRANLVQGSHISKL